MRVAQSGFEGVAAHSQIKKARLARKELKYLSKQRLFLLCVQLRAAWHRIPNASLEKTIVAQLFKTVKLPGRVLIFVPRGAMKGVARKMSALADAIIYKGQD